MKLKLHRKLKLGFLLFFLGCIGILSLLTMDIPIPEEAQEIVRSYFTPIQIKLLSLINPTFLLIIAVVVGTLLYDKVNFKLPLLEGLVYGKRINNLKSILKYGVLGGVISGILILGFLKTMNPELTSKFLQLQEAFEPTLVARLLYGGITEELLVRFGFTTFIVFLVYKIGGRMTTTVYWSGIVIAAFVFGAGHLPIVYSISVTPTVALITYIVLVNAVGGVIFGWLYWKKGLEAAILAHMTCHIVLLLS